MIFVITGNISLKFFTDPYNLWHVQKYKRLVVTSLPAFTKYLVWKEYKTQDSLLLLTYTTTYMQHSRSQLIPPWVSSENITYRGHKLYYSLGIGLLKECRPELLRRLAVYKHQLPIDGGQSVINNHLPPLPTPPHTEPVTTRHNVIIIPVNK